MTVGSSIYLPLPGEKASGARISMNKRLLMKIVATSFMPW